MSRVWFMLGYLRFPVAEERNTRVIALRETTDNLFFNYYYFFFLFYFIFYFLKSPAKGVLFFECKICSLGFVFYYFDHQF
jgi:hypothetical protein